MMKPVIREATLADAIQLADFNAAMARETENRALDTVTLLAGVKGLFETPSRGRYYVAQVGPEVAGQLMITHEWSDWRNATFWWIQSVYVLPAFRRQGIYRALHEHVLLKAKSDSGVCGIRLYVDRQNVSAQETYRALGMIPSHYDLYEIDFRQGS